MSTKPVLVVVGAGGMGLAIARRSGAGRTVVLADFDETVLHESTSTLEGEGYAVVPVPVDVSSRDSVRTLAEAAERSGPVLQVAHTAGLSPVQAPALAILRVDLLGVALALEEFEKVIAPGGAGVVISSMAGHTAAPLTPEQESQLALAPSDDLLDLPFAAVDQFDHPLVAYGFAKHTNHLRVRGASPAWGARGARINSISPGIISTPMGQQELAGESGEMMRMMIERSAAKRLGTAAGDIAAAVDFLLGPSSTFISGTDLLVDGGVIAALSVEPSHA
jgi:NAD(P)-dependent dehydrogenase (short-subunit alcohol dehydrogenase family)